MTDGGIMSIAPNQLTFTNGQPVTLTVADTPGDRFQGWTGDAIGTNNPLTLLMTTNRAVFAHFRAYQIAWTNLANGDWNEPLNSSPNLMPDADDDVTISNFVTFIVNAEAHCHNFVLGIGGQNPTLSGSGALTIHGSWVWTTGIMSGNGRTIIAPEATLTIANLGGVSLNTRTLDNEGTALWTGAGGIVVNNGVITNGPGALFQVLNTASLSFGGGAARFDNAGTFRKSSSGTTTANIAFNNYGVVELLGGNLDLSSGGTHTGSFDVSAGRTMIFSGASHTASASSTLAGDGNLTVSGSGTTTLAGFVNLSGTHTLGPHGQCHR
jgi:uncharacterized repeat protein (TIGR02543 family)